jgi:uncharacterized protein YdaU (DUF1376 family)
MITTDEGCAMNYYNRYPGDYARDTQDLSLAEHGAYALLLDYLYGTQQVLPKNPVGLYRVCRAFSDDEKRAVDAVVSRFFVELDDGYTNKRYELESEKAKARIDAARENGKRGGRGQKKTQQEPSGFESANPAGLNPLTQQEPSGSALHTPSSIVLKEESPNGDSQLSVDNCPHDKILDLFAKTLPELTQPIRSRWSGSKGATQLRTRWREDKRHQKIEFWEWYFGIVRKNPFYIGQNDRSWRADLPWLLKRDNFDKILSKGVSNGC